MAKNENIKLDVEIGSNEPRDWTKKEFDEFDKLRKQRFEKLPEEEKVHNALLTFRYTLEKHPI